jgi:serine/threonine protein kinase
MDPSRLSAPGASTIEDQKDKARRVKEAKEVYQTILRKAEKSGSSAPPYDFLELIGKGAYGRVYKCRDQRSGNLVAIKITNIDDQDWESNFEPSSARDETIRDFTKEVSILQQLKDNNVRNVNVIHDAFDWHSQLWIVAAYCTGGSVRTLMRPFERNGRPTGLPLEYIIPIARELAIAVREIHAMHVIHRDIKCANVYITEDGEIQLGDFGIVGVMNDSLSKRNTVVGTPHWLPSELVSALTNAAESTAVGYGTEVDIWSYGCTVFEMATGNPPFANKHMEDIPDLIAEAAPSLGPGQYPQELRDFITFCLDRDPRARPTAEMLLRHPFIANTSQKYPSTGLIRLIERFKIWEHGGGSRASLWIASPADPRVADPDGPTPEDEDEDLSSWNFSTSDTFDQEFSRRYSQMPSLSTADTQQASASSGSSLAPLNTTNLSVAERIKREHTELAANRGERSLARLYDPDDPSGYQLATPVSAISKPPSPPPTSDLPLRSFTSDAPTRESMIEIDLDGADVNETATSTFALHMATLNEHTLRPTGRATLPTDDDDEEYEYNHRDDDDRRATLEWTFPQQHTAPAPSAPAAKRGTMDWSFHTAELRTDEAGLSPDLPFGVKPQLKHSATEPLGHFRSMSHGTGESQVEPNRDSIASMIDLDMGLADPAGIRRPSTASSIAGSVMTDITSGNPFDLEDDPLQNELDRSRFSYHKQWQSEGGQSNRHSNKSVLMRTRGSSLSSTASDLDHGLVDIGNSFGEAPYIMSQQSSFGLGLGLDETTQWPNFDDFDNSLHFPTASDIPRLGTGEFPLERGLRANGFGNATSQSRDPSVDPSRGPEVGFPVVEAPHPAALAEEADPNMLIDEMARMLDALSHGLTSAQQSLSRTMQIEDDDGYMSSDIDGGFDSNREATEDEATPDYSEQLTARRKPRKLEIRTPSSPPEASS